MRAATHAQATTRYASHLDGNGLPNCVCYLYIKWSCLFCPFSWGCLNVTIDRRGDVGRSLASKGQVNFFLAILRMLTCPAVQGALPAYEIIWTNVNYVFIL